MKRSGWALENARNYRSRKKGLSRMINEILKDSYRLHAGDRATQKAVKRCLG